MNIDATAPPDEVKYHADQLIKRLKREIAESDTNQEESIINVDLWDFAGQHLYYASHPVFFSLQAIYLLVFNLSKPLNKLAEPYVRQGRSSYRLDNPSGETNIENLLSWLATVHNITQMRGENVSDNGQKEANYLQPPVLIVGTHADEPSDQILSVHLEIQKEIERKEYEKHVVPPIFSIDNTGTPAEKEHQAGKDHECPSCLHHFTET